MDRQKLLNQRELIMDDIECVLDGVDDYLINTCQDIIIERFKILLDETEDVPNDYYRRIL